jgi:Ran GTPase-activating protein (RanGAP) involved in mRNA processing and transport
LITLKSQQHSDTETQQKQLKATMSSPKLATYDSLTLAKVLGDIPSQDWQRTWPYIWTGMLRQTCKSVKDAIDTHIQPLTSFRLSYSDYDRHNRTIAEKLGKDLKKLAEMSLRLNITTLNLNECDIKRPKAIQLLAEVLKNGGRLVKLNLSKNDLGDNGLQAIATNIHCPALEHLDLSYNDFGVPGVEYLAGVLGQCKGLRHIDLYANQCGDDGVNILVDAIEKCPNIDSIVLGANNIGPAGIERLARVFKYWQNLFNIDLCCNQIGNTGVESLALVLPNCKNMSHLNLAYNQIGPEGARHLASALPKCNNLALIHINLCNNEFGDDGIEILANAIGQCNNLALTELNLLDNQIGDDGAHSIGRILTQCPGLRSLSLGSNLIDYAGILSITVVLGQSNNLALTQLDLSNNKFGDDGVEILAGVLSQCTALTELNLADNHIGDNGADSIGGVLPQCPNLRHLYLDNNLISDDASDRLADILMEECPLLVCSRSSKTDTSAYA